MPFGRFTSCRNFRYALELGALGEASVLYALDQHADECACDCDMCNDFRRLRDDMRARLEECSETK